MKLTVEIELGNETMQTAADVIDRLPKEIYRGLERGLNDPIQAGDGGKIRDLNGNTVGSWTVSEEVSEASHAA